MSGTTAPCRVCGQLVSEYAERCAGCGDQTARRYGHAKGSSTSPWTIIGWIVLVLLLLSLGSCIEVLGA